MKTTHLNILIFGLTLGVSSQSLLAEEWSHCQPWPKPSFSYPGPVHSNGSAPMILNADSSESQDNKVVTLKGNVKAQRPNEQLTADEARYDKLKNIFEAKGNIRYDTEDFTATGSYTQIKLDSRHGHFENSEYFAYERHARGQSKSIELEGKDLTILKSTSYTTCNADDEDWVLRASTVELNHATGMGSAYNARLAFQGVPFLYIPFITFPITNERMSGLLPPSFGSSGLGGNEVALPIYLNIHPQLDATVTPHNYTNRGLQWENELRYLTGVGEGIIRSEQLDDEVYGSKRSLYEYSHRGNISSGWSTDLLFNRVSDEDYFNDFGNSLSISSITHLERHARLSHNHGWGQFSIQAQDYQTIDADIPNSSRPYRRLPQITYNASATQGSLLNYRLDSELVYFKRDTSLSGKRLNIKPSINLSYDRPAGFITPKLSANHTRYAFDDEYNTVGTDTLERTTPITSIDSGLYLERDTTFGQTAFLQTLEPRLFYLYVPYRDQADFPLFDTGALGFSTATLFSESRFSGADRIGDTEQVTLSLTSRLLRADDGREKARLTAGQIYYLEDRQVALSGNVLDESTKSDTIIEGVLQPSTFLSLKADLLWNTEYDTITRRDFRLQFLRDNQHIVNLAYRERGNRVTSPDTVSREIDGSVLWPLSQRWSMIGRRYHSLPDNRTLEKMAGIEYDDCCWAFRAVRRAVFTEDTAASVAPFGRLRYSWYLQLELKGLTSIGKRIESFMEDQIIGYTSTP